MKPSDTLDNLLRSQSSIWRGLQSNRSAQPSLPTGFAELDTLLPGGGWPVGALLSITLTCLGIGELRLLLPAMATLSQQGRSIVWIAPPYQPYAPGLLQAGIDLAQVLIVACSEAADIPWTLEKLLRSGRCGMALAWPQRLASHQTRRLQLAAEAGKALAVLFVTDRGSQSSASNRPNNLAKFTTNPQPLERRFSNASSGFNVGYAALQIELQRQNDGLALHIRKARGSLQRHNLLLDL